MKASIRDVPTLQAVRPLELVTYLRAHNWREEQMLDRGAFWVKEVDGHDFEILIPLDTRLRDFANRITETLQTLEIVEHRSQLEIIEDLSMIGADIIRPRLPGVNTE